jgi:hypothetical protein
LVEVPSRAEDGLLVLGDEVAVHEQIDQIAVAPQLAQLEVEQVAVRLDDLSPFGVVGCLDQGWRRG